MAPLLSPKKQTFDCVSNLQKTIQITGKCSPVIFLQSKIEMCLTLYTLWKLWLYRMRCDEPSQSNDMWRSCRDWCSESSRAPVSRKDLSRGLYARHSSWSAWSCCSLLQLRTLGCCPSPGRWRGDVVLDGRKVTLDLFRRSGKRLASTCQSRASTICGLI